MPDALVLSPHLDDAVLSASARLSQGAHVVTVFAGVPPDSLPVASWDRLSGATGSAQRQRERLEEDSAAMASFPVTWEHWQHLDGQYRDRLPDLAALRDSILSLLSPGIAAWSPAGIGHPDHMAVRAAALDAARQAGLPAITLYADVPHAIPYGWPPSVTGAPPHPYLDIDGWLDEQLVVSGLDPGRLQTHVVRLSAAQRETKETALRCYRSQLAVLRLDPAAVAADPSLLAFELAWTLRLQSA